MIIIIIVIIELRFWAFFAPSRLGSCHCRGFETKTKLSTPAPEYSVDKKVENVYSSFEITQLLPPNIREAGIHFCDREFGGLFRCLLDCKIDQANVKINRHSYLRVCQVVDLFFVLFYIFSLSILVKLCGKVK